jgi:hypothetical protein
MRAREQARLRLEAGPFVVTILAGARGTWAWGGPGCEIGPSRGAKSARAGVRNRPEPGPAAGVRCLGRIGPRSHGASRGGGPLQADWSDAGQSAATIGIACTSFAAMGCIGFGRWPRTTPRSMSRRPLYLAAAAAAGAALAAAAASSAVAVFHDPAKDCRRSRAQDYLRTGVAVII